MAANEVKLTIRIAEDGKGLDIISDKSKKAAGSLDKLSSSTNKLNNSRNTFNRQEKGVAGLTSNSTKAFAKQAQTIGGGLVPAYATLAANVFAITAAFNALRSAQATELLAQGLDRVGDAAGRNLPYVADRLKEITGAAISTQQAMEAVALGTSSGFSQEQLEGLAKVASGASKALGRDMADALSRLTRGAAKLEPEILDELGIIVRLDDAYTRYGAKIGKTADQLSILEQRQAFVNAILDDGLGKYKEIAEAIDPNAYDQLSAAFEELSKAFLNLINGGLTPLISLFAGNKAALTGATILFGSTISKQMIPALYNGAEAAAKSAFTMRQHAEALQANISTTGNLPKVYKQLSTSIQEGTATQGDYDNALKSLNRSITLHSKQLGALEKDHTTEAATLETKKLKLAEVEKARKTLVTTMALQRTASAKQGIANAVEAASTLDLIDSYKLLSLSIKEKIAAEKLSSTSSTGAVGILGKLRIAGFAAAGGIRVLGAAFLAAIPFIGLAVTAGSFLLDFFRNTGGESKKLEEGVNKATESFSNFESVAALLQENLANPMFNPLITQATALNGVFDEIRSRVKETQDDILNFRVNRIKELDELIANLNKTIADPSTISAGQALKNFFSTGSIYGNVTQDLRELREERQSLIDATGDLKDPFIDVQTARTVLRAAIKDLEVFGAATKEQRDALRDFEVGLTSETTITQLEAALAGIGTEEKRLVSALTNSKDAFGRFQQEITKFSQKQITPFDDILTQVDLLENQLATLSGEEAEAVIASLGRSFTKVFGTTQAQVTKTANEANRLRQILIDTPGELIKLEAQQKAVTAAASGSADALNKSLTLSNRIVEKKITEKEAELSLINLLTAGNEELKRAEELRSDIAGLSQKLLSNELIAAQVRVQEIADQQRLLGVQERIVSAKDAQARAEQQIARARIVLANAQDPLRQDISVRAKQEKDLFNQEYEARRRMVLEQNWIRIQGIEAEYDLLDAQAQLLRLRLQEAGLGTEGIDSYISKLGKAEEAALNAQRATTRAALISLARQKEENVISTEQAILSAAGTGDSTTERFRNLSEQGGLSELDTVNEKVAAARQAIAPMLEDLKGLGPQGEYINAIAQGAFVIADSFTAAFETSAKGMEKAAGVAQAVGDSIGAVNSIIQSGIQATIAQIDKEIAAEKKRDGKSSESIAKIQAMERKKEQQQRKAFETNKKMMMAQTVANTAAAVMGALGNQPWTPGNFALAALVGAIGAAQLAIIAGTSFEGGGGGSAGAGTPTSVSLGERRTSVDTATSQSATGELAYLRGAQGVGGPENFRPTNAFAGMKYRANGGNTGVMVGEQGPELFVPDRPGRIVPSDEVQQSTPTNVNFSINAIDAAGVEEVLVAQRGNIIGILREAANAHGQEFLESVDVSVYTAPSRRTV